MALNTFSCWGPASFPSPALLGQSTSIHTRKKQIHSLCLYHFTGHLKAEEGTHGGAPELGANPCIPHLFVTWERVFVSVTSSLWASRGRNPSHASCYLQHLAKSPASKCSIDTCGWRKERTREQRKWCVRIAQSTCTCKFCYHHRHSPSSSGCLTFNGACDKLGQSCQCWVRFLRNIVNGIFNFYQKCILFTLRFFISLFVECMSC